MVRYPFTLEYLYEADAEQLPDGSWEEGVREWRSVGRCNAHQNSNARMMTAQNGEVYSYSYEIVMPSDSCPIHIGTPVRVLDAMGNNIFAHHVCGDSEDVAEVSYAVKGYYRSGQRYAKTKIWV